jgi:hypothetical protein
MFFGGIINAIFQLDFATGFFSGFFLVHWVRSKTCGVVCKAGEPRTNRFVPQIFTKKRFP